MSNPTIKKRVCDRCGKEFFETYREWLCKDCMNELGWEYTPKTNADHIRSMTDEELAELFRAFCEASDCISPSGAVCPFYSKCPIDMCVGNHLWLDWLRTPYKEEV